MKEILLLLKDLPLMFRGEFYVDSDEISEMKDNLYDIRHIPTAKDDKEALRGDLNSVLKDTRKAVNHYKKEFCNG